MGVQCRRGLHNGFIAVMSLGFFLFWCVHPLAPRWTTPDSSDQFVQRVFSAALVFHGYLALNALTYMCRSQRSRVADSFAMFFHTLAVPEFLDHAVTMAALVAVRPAPLPLSSADTTAAEADEAFQANNHRVNVFLHMTCLSSGYWLCRAVTNFFIKPNHGTDLGRVARNVVIYLFVAGGVFDVASTMSQSLVVYWSFQKHWDNKSLTSWNAFFSNQHTADHVFLVLFSIQVLFKYLWIARAVKFICKLFQPDTVSKSRFSLFARRHQTQFSDV